MSLKKLFLAHYSGDVDEVRQLATALRLHGIVPWLDKEGGFTVADESDVEARRAIRDDCFGLLLYATDHVFDRPFIRDVEVDEAIRVRKRDQKFALFAVPRGISFPELQERSIRSFGTDLSAFHTLPAPQELPLEQVFGDIAAEVLRRVLQRAVASHDTDSLSLQFSTLERMPDEPTDVLRIDATGLFHQGVGSEAEWKLLLTALARVKSQIAAVYGRPRLYVHGSKRLSAAFAFGRVFSPYEMNIRQTATAVWQTDAEFGDVTPLTVEIREMGPKGGPVLVEVATGRKNIAQGVDMLIAQNALRPSVRVQLRPAQQPPEAIDNSLCCAMVEQTYHQLEAILQEHYASEVHLFVAAPQSFMIMLGRLFRGMPQVNVYEWDGSKYILACKIPGNIM